MTRLYLFGYQASAAHPADRTGLAGRRRGDSTVKAVRRRPVAATDYLMGRYDDEYVRTNDGRRFASGRESQHGQEGFDIQLQSWKDTAVNDPMLIWRKRDILAFN